jgi:hypothetical protein
MQSTLRKLNKAGRILNTLNKNSLVQTSAASFATGKDIKFGTEARALMLEGVDMLADAV